MNENQILTPVVESPASSAPVVSEDDVEKSDVVIERPPPRRSGTIKVKLQYAGRSKPIPVDFPDDE
jgi:hypothetical protein